MRENSPTHSKTWQQWENGARPLPVVAVRDLRKTYLLGQTKVFALRGVNLKVYPGEFVAVMGPSGSGKSTLLNLLGCLDRPTSGEYWLTGVSAGQMRSRELADIRNRHIGFVFQSFNLLSRESALANVMLPLMYRGLAHRLQEQRAYRALQLVGLGDRIHHRPAQLSGGQQQRVAIARALVNQPSLLLADEPTGNLDSQTSLEILALLQALNERGITIIVVTHEASVASVAQRRVTFHDGCIVQDEASSPSLGSQKDRGVEVQKEFEGEPAQIREEHIQKEDLDEYE